MNRKFFVGLNSSGVFNGFYATGNNSNLFKGENRISKFGALTKL